MGRVASFAAALEPYHFIGFDTMVFIYHFEDHPVFADLTQILFRAIAEGKLSAHVSVLLAGEVLVGPKKVGDQESLLHYRHVFGNYPNLVVHPVTMEVMERVSDLRARQGLPTPDAIHLATALVHGAQAFVTNDKRLRRVAPDGLDILVLSDFTEEN